MDLHAPDHHYVTTRTAYHYSSLLPGNGNIRLLRLLPNGDRNASIECQLLNYSLESSQGDHQENHLYEALSYVWGDPKEKLPILIGTQSFGVTINLHSALSRLRNHSFERVLWVDAICIDQNNQKEKEGQIRSMANIYGQANRVVVWLGDDADDSHQALEDIRIAAKEESTDTTYNNQAVIALLQRSWFERIWVLQEVALARRILIVCGGTAINGHAFCLGLKRLKILDSDNPGLQDMIRSMTYLMREAIFRPQQAVSLAGEASLGELIDMYHTRKATVRHDKVYALLGMSSDDPSANGLSPNYALPWKNLLHQLIEFVLCKTVSVRVFDEREIVMINSKGCVVGQISSVTSDNTRYDRQQVNISFNNDTSVSLSCQKRWGVQWTLQASAKSIWQGDIVCLLEGAAKPTIIRISKDYFCVIVIAVTPLQDAQMASRKVEPQCSLHLSQSLLRNFLLVWNWAEPLEDLQQQTGHTILTADDAQVLEYSEGTAKRATRLYDVALILKDVEEYEAGRKCLQELFEGTEEIFGIEHPYQLVNREIDALICKKAGKWENAEEIFLQVVETRKQVYGIDHPDTLDSMAHLVSLYIAQSNSLSDELDVTHSLATLAKQVRENAEITEGELLEVAQLFRGKLLALLLGLRTDKVVITAGIVNAAAGNYYGKDVMTVLLDRRGADVLITEEVVKAAAGNYHGKDIMTLLLDRRGADVLITEEVVKAAAGNSDNGKDIITLLLDRRGADVLITEEVVVIVMGNFDKDVAALLLERLELDVLITEEVVKAAAGNYYGRDIMTLLLDRQGADVLITEEVVKAAAGNYHGEDIITLLLDRRGADVLITDEVVKAAAGSHHGKDIITLLLDRRGADVLITEEVVKAAAGNCRNGKDVMKLLLDRRGADVLITEEVLKAAAENWHDGKRIIRLLLDRRGADVLITEELVKAAAGNYHVSDIITLLLDRWEQTS